MKTIPKMKTTPKNEDDFVKLWLGALIPRSPFLSACLSVCPSSKEKNKKKYRTLQNFAKPYKTLKDDKIMGFQPVLSLMRTVKEASAICRIFLDGVVIFLQMLTVSALKTIEAKS